MKYLLTTITLLLTACNFGLVDIEERPELCYDQHISIGRDSVWIDSTAKDCGYTRVTTPFDRFLENPWKEAK